MGHVLIHGQLGCSEIKDSGCCIDSLHCNWLTYWALSVFWPLGECFIVLHVFPVLLIIMSKRPTSAFEWLDVYRCMPNIAWWFTSIQVNHFFCWWNHCSLGYCEMRGSMPPPVFVHSCTTSTSCETQRQTATFLPPVPNSASGVVTERSGMERLASW